MTTNSISNITNGVRQLNAGIDNIVDSFGHALGFTSQQARHLLTYHKQAGTCLCSSLLDSWFRARDLAEAVEWLDGKSHIVEWIGLEGLERGIENAVMMNGKAAATKERAAKNYLKKTEKKLRATYPGRNIVFAGNITTITDYISEEQMEELRHLPAEQQERAVKMNAQSFRSMSHISLADFLSTPALGKRTLGEMIKITQAANADAPKSKGAAPTSFDGDETKSLIIIDDAFTIEGHLFIKNEKAPKLARDVVSLKKFLLLPIVSGNEVGGEDRWDVATTCEVFEHTEHNGWQEIAGEWKVEVLSPASA